MEDEFLKHENTERTTVNLLRNFDACVDMVVMIEKEMGNQVTSEDRYALRQKMSDALAKVEEDRSWVNDPEEKENFERRVVSGFHGLGGFNRYSVRGDGSIGLAKSHSTEACIRKAQELGIDTPEFLGM